MNFNTSRARATKCAREGFEFMTKYISNAERVVACKYDSETKKQKWVSIGTYDEKMQKMLKQLKINVRRAKRG